MVMPFVGKLVSYVSARSLVFLGTIGFIISCLMLRNMTLLTGGREIFWALVLRGASMGFLFVPLALATLISLRGKEIGEGTGLFNLTRQLGGSAGIAILSTFVTHQTMAHRAALVEHITAYNPLAQYRTQLMQGFFMLKGSSASVAHLRAMQVIDQTIQGQAAVMSFSDAFSLIALLFLLATVFLLLFKGGKMSMGGKPKDVQPE
jgi:DHA2 family multidrug resistance protein